MREARSEPAPYAKARRRRAAGRRLLAVTLVGAGYAAVLLAFLLWPARQGAPVAPPPILMTLVDGRTPRPDPDPGDRPTPDEPAPARAADHRAPRPAAAPPPTPSSRTAPARRSIARRAARDQPDRAAPTPGLSDAELAGAATVESGAGASGGGACDMARRLQAALRKDAMVRAAVPGGAARPVLVWNGDWVQGQGEDGKGLAAVREAIMWEIGFSPAACKAGPVRGYVLLALSDAPGAPRLVLGARDWRWSDLLK